MDNKNERDEIMEPVEEMMKEFGLTETNLRNPINGQIEESDAAKGESDIMTDREFEDRERLLYEIVQFIVERATCIALGGRNYMDLTYRDDTRINRYRKHLDCVGYGLSDLWDLIKKLRDVLSELEIEYDQQPKEGDKHERSNR